MKKDVRTAWRKLRDDLREEYRDTKYAEDALTELSNAYSTLPEDEREVVDELLGEWALASDDIRFDALFLIGEHRITATIPALRRLARRLEDSSDAMAISKWGLVNGIIGELTDERHAEEQ